MDRLKELINYYQQSVDYLAKNWNVTTRHMEMGEIRQHREHCQIEDDTLVFLKELQRYKDLEEQGRLIELPCKVGDTVWAIFPTWTPMKCEVVAIEILTSTVNIEAKVVDSDADRIFWPADFGKTVFLTKEEAEEALKRLQGNE